jgi:hypothetical protein
MTDILSQDDLDALWTLPPPEETENLETPQNEASSGEGISQADLDALFGALGGTDNGVAPKKNESTAVGFSQADLNALGGLTSDGGIQEPAAVIEENRAPVGENLSQDDIDRLLAEMGK